MPRVRFATALGPCALAWEGDRVTGFALPGGDAPEPGAPEAWPPGTPDWVRALAGRVQRHLAGELQDFTDVPLADADQPAFARRVYAAARRIPAGTARTYGELAAALGEPPAAARAVGAALGANPWPLLVPCHRVVGAHGRLTGFSAPGGVRTKARLLAIEGHQLLAE